jgi:8-oxo-dGTP diphosphatase
LKSYTKYTLCIIRNNRLLVKQENELKYYTLPGGEAGEEEGAIQALCRVIKEELGVELDIASLNYLGEFQDDNGDVQDNSFITVELYLGGVQGQLKPHPEIKRLIWFSKDDDWNDLSPVTKNKILPLLIQKGLLT